MLYKHARMGRLCRLVSVLQKAVEVNNMYYVTPEKVVYEAVKVKLKLQ